MARILVVDDEKSVRITMRELLRDAGYEVGVAEDAEEALGVLAAEEFDVVVADIIMPRITGMHFLQSLKDTSSAARVILMTGEPTVETASEAVRADAFDYLFKPIGKVRLLKTVANAVEAKSLDDEGRRLAEENRRHQEDLERLVEERTADLRESEERFRDLYDNAPVAYFAVGRDRRIRRVNEKTAELLGCAHDDLIGRPIFDFYADTPDGKEKARQVFQRFLAGERSHDEELQMRRADGRLIWISLRVDVVRDADGEVEEMRSIVIDITERRHMEASLRQAQKLESIGTLAGGVAHDFNNVLQAILLGTDATIAAVESALGASSPLLAGLRGIEADAMRAVGLTHQLLTFSRQDVSRPTALDLGRVLAEMEEMLRRLIPEHIVLTMSLDPGLPHIHADRSRIEQIIMNLVVNSRDAMPDGGEMIVETASVTLSEAQVATHGSARPGPHILLSVSDTGIGMSPETRDRIFEPFFTTKKKGQGTGLGLATVHGIVKAAGGHILVDSEPGQGTNFRIYLPAIEGAAEEPDERPDTALGGTETVLFCEDDERIRAMVVRSLRTGGYTVLAADNGEQALRLAAEHRAPIDLLVTDVIMPGMNGKQLADALTAIYPGLRTLFISGYTADLIGRHGVLDDGVEFLAKPFKARSLLSRARQLLDEPLSLDAVD